MRNKIIVALMLLCLLPGPLTVAQADDVGSCGNTNNDKTRVDLRRKGGSMEGIPVLDQDGLAYCYGYASSVMVTAWMRTHANRLSRDERNKMIISPFAAVQMAELSPDAGKYATHHPCMIAETILKSGACSVDHLTLFNGSDYSLMDAPNITMNKCVRWDAPGVLKDTNEKINGLYLQVKDIAATCDLNDEKWKKDRETIMNYIRKKHIGNPAVDVDVKKFNLYHPGVDDAKLSLIADYTRSAKSTFEVQLALLAPSCAEIKKDPVNSELSFSFKGDLGFDLPYGKKKRKIQPFAKCEHQSKWHYDSHINQSSHAPAEYLKDFNAHFDQKNPQPLVIDYCWTFLSYGARVPRHESDDSGKESGCYDDKGKSHVDHKSVLIGRRWNAAQSRCEYLLRNSWGNDCNSYDTAYYYSCRDELATNKAADIWVPADVITHNVHGYSSLK